MYIIHYMISIIYSFIVPDSTSIPWINSLIEFDCNYDIVCLTLLVRACHRLLLCLHQVKMYLFPWLTFYELESARKEEVVLTRPEK